MEFLDEVGFLGLALLLSAFFLNQIKRLSSESLAYHLLNFTGAYILTFYAFKLGNTPFIILEFVWGSVSLIKLLTFKRSRPLSI